MSDLWIEINGIDREIESLWKKRCRLMRRAQKVPSERDLKICFAYLNDRKLSEIADEFALSEGRVSRIVKACIPFAAGKLRNFGRSL